MLGGASTLGSSTNPNAPQTYDQFRQQLVGQFTTNTPGGPIAPNAPNLYEQGLSNYNDGQMANYNGRGEGPGHWVNSGNNAGEKVWVPGGMTEGTSSIDEQGLDAAIRQRLAEQQAAADAREAAARADPQFGSLAQGFQFNTYTPEKYTAGTFSYTGEDLYDDPSYQFRLQQGQKALDRQGAAAGRFLSGGQLQASSNYNQSAASQEFQNAYQRALGTFSTNEGNRFSAFNTNEGNRFGAFNQNEGNRYNAYQTNFTNTVNPLLALSGAGQLATTQLMGNNSQYASNVGANLMGAANASGAAGIASSNAMGGALSNVANQYQTQQLMNRFGGSMNANPGSAYPAGANYAGDNAGYMG